MAEPRPFPPSPRRLALARRAGLHAASPIVVGAVGLVAAVVVIAALGRAIAARLGEAIASACRGQPQLDAADVAATTLELALPLVGAIAIAAIAAHVAQTRALWLPRRALPHAPTVEPGRTRGAARELAGAAVVGGATLGWLWLMAPALARLPVAPLGAGAALLVSALATLAVAWVALAAVDAIARHLAVATALRMTPADKREDDRAAGADPRWARHRRELAHVPASLAGATLLVLGDDRAIAIAWDPVHRPVPARLARGRGARATQLLGLARRHAIAVHRDPALAAALDDRGPIPERLWPRLATVIAAIGRR